MKFDERLHKPSALSDEVRIIYDTNPDTIILGSLGRAVLFGVLAGNPTAEFEARQELPERKIEYGEELARDIDVVATGTDSTENLGPFEVDREAFVCRQLSLVNQNGDWYLTSPNKGIYEELHPSVMEPVTGESVYGIKSTTVPLQTHQALFGLKGAMRPKDQSNLNFLKSLEELNKHALPPELYEPFDRLRVLANSGWLHQTRRAYRTVVPWPVRSRIVPITSRIKERLI